MGHQMISKAFVSWTHAKVYDDGLQMTYLWKYDKWDKNEAKPDVLDKYCDEITEDELFIDLI